MSCLRNTTIDQMQSRFLSLKYCTENMRRYPLSTLLTILLQVSLLLRGEDHIPDMADITGLAGFARLLAALPEARAPQPHEEGGRDRPLDGKGPGITTAKFQF